MDDVEKDREELRRLVGELASARQELLDSAQALGPDALDARAAASPGWTVRRLLEYCRANERWHFSRMFNFFEPEVKVYDAPAASLDTRDPERSDKTLARECAEVWLAGRETEMWMDLVEGEGLDAIRHASRSLPQGGWTIREVFQKVTSVYVENARALGESRSR